MSEKVESQPGREGQTTHMPKKKKTGVSWREVRQRENWYWKCGGAEKRKKGSLAGADKKSSICKGAGGKGKKGALLEHCPETFPQVGGEGERNKRQICNSKTITL